MNSLTKPTKTPPPEIIIDTSTLFSALYNPKGNEASLLTLAHQGTCSIHLYQYVLDELQHVFKRKQIAFNMVIKLLETYDNIIISELLHPTEEELHLAKSVISDPKDRPIFVFALRKIRENTNAYFVTGDKLFFKKQVQTPLQGKVKKTKDIIRILCS